VAGAAREDVSDERANNDLAVWLPPVPRFARHPARRPVLPSPRWRSGTEATTVGRVEDVRFEELEFVIGWCAICDREVLTYADFDADATARRNCVHCDQWVQRGLRAAPGEELPDHGYGLLETQGCGNPACGGGQCSRRQNEH